MKRPPPADTHGLLFADLLEQLAAVPQEQQTKLVGALAARLDFPTSLFLVSSITDRLCSMPVLDALPSNILAAVLQRLDHRTLLSLAACSRQLHQAIMADQSIWAQLALQADPMPRECQVWMGRNAMNAVCLVVSDYVSAYRWWGAVRRNWAANLARTAVVEIPGARTVTALEVDWERCRVHMASDDSLVRVYALGGPLVGSLAGHQGGVWAMQAAGDLLFTGSTDRTVGLWDVRSMARRADLVGHASTVRALVVHEQYVISGSRDGVIRVWEWATGACVHTLSGHAASVRCLDVWVDGDGLAYVVSGSYDETCIVWDLRAGRAVRRLEGHSGRIYALKVLGGHVYTAGMDHRVLKWDPVTGRCVADIFTGQVLIGMLEARGRFVVAGSTDGRVCVIDAHTSTVRHMIAVDVGGAGPSITSLAINQSFLVATTETAAVVYDLDSGEQLSTLLEHATMVWRAACSDCWCCIAYQQEDATRLLTADFTPHSLK